MRLRQRGQAQMTTVEILMDVEVTPYGAIIEEVQVICTMTGFRRRFLFHYLGEGFFRSVELQTG